LENGADPTVSNNLPMKIIVGRNDINLVRLLMNYGADINAGEVYFEKVHTSSVIDTHVGCHLPMIDFLIKNNVNLFTRKNFNIFFRNKECTKFMLNAGFDTSILEADDFMNVFMLLEFEIVKLLIQSGFDTSKLKINDLIKIFMTGDSEIINFLVQHGVNFSILNEKTLYDQRTLEAHNNILARATTLNIDANVIPVLLIQYEINTKFKFE
jgi:hypothetical protein